MNLADLREQRSRIIADADALMQSPTAETRTAFDAKMSEVDGIDADIKRLERIAAEPSTRSNRPAPVNTEDRAAQEKIAFRNFLTGKPVETRDLLTINAAGAALIPQGFYPEIIRAKKDWGGITNLVKNINTDTGNPMKMALVNDTNFFMNTNTEGQALYQDVPVASNLTLSTEELRSGAFKVSLDELQDSAWDLDAFIRDVIGKSYYRTLNQLVTVGSGHQIASVVTGYAANEVTTAAAGTVTYADLLALYGALESAYVENASFVMNNATRTALMGLVDGFGRPLFDVSVTTGPFSTIFGRPVVINNAMPTVASGNVAVQFGDFASGYILRTVNPGLSVIRLNERFMDQLEVGFVGYARAGGIVTNAGIAPIVNLAVK